MKHDASTRGTWRRIVLLLVVTLAMLGLPARAALADTPQPEGTVTPSTGLVDQQSANMVGIPDRATFSVVECPAGRDPSHPSCQLLITLPGYSAGYPAHVQARLWDPGTSSVIDCRSGPGACEVDVRWQYDGVEHQLTTPLTFVPGSTLRPTRAHITPSGVLADGAVVTVTIDEFPQVELAAGAHTGIQAWTLTQCGPTASGALGCSADTTKPSVSLTSPVAAKFQATDGSSVDCTAAGGCLLRVSAGPLWTADVPLPFATVTSATSSSTSPGPAAEPAGAAASADASTTTTTSAKKTAKHSTELAAARHAVTADSSSGTSTTTWLWALVLVLLVLLGAACTWWYRRRNAPPQANA